MWIWWFFSCFMNLNNSIVAKLKKNTWWHSQKSFQSMINTQSDLTLDTSTNLVFEFRTICTTLTQFIWFFFFILNSIWFCFKYRSNNICDNSTDSHHTYSVIWKTKKRKEKSNKTFIEMTKYWCCKWNKMTFLG